MEAEFAKILHMVALVIEGAGVAVLVGGMVVAGFFAAKATSMQGRFETLRRGLGHTILLGLEVLVIGDIIRTVAIEPTLRGVGVLAIIVFIRTFLSFSISTELDGVLPWRRKRVAND